MISNRLPVSKDPFTGETKLSSGGLVSALGGIHNDITKLWIGLEPQHFTDGQPASTLSERHGEIEFRGVAVDHDQYDLYYNGISNDMLWPLFHYEGSLVHFSREAWAAYVHVNQLLADTVAEEALDDETVWIHDFHLFLVPHMLRRRRPSVRIGFFLHIPFPSSEVFRQLPMREEILYGILGADLIGFHDYSYIRHFGNALHAVLGIDSDLLSLNFDGRRITLGAFPVSIDTQSFVEKAKSLPVSKILRRYKRTFRDVQVILGVDRLDYVKGLLLKLRSFRELLHSNPELVGKVQLIQIAIPTRQDVADYAKLKNDLEQLVGEINGQFGRADYNPIFYIYNTVDFDELLALYRLADCLLVSSRRDGMNLVALEYIASQSTSHPGIVVLSEFTGASATLSHALKINPWDVEKSADVLKKALSLDYKKRREMHQPMLRYLMNYNATDWATSFMKALEQTRSLPVFEKLIRLTPDNIEDEFLNRLRNTKLFVFDYDGTLVPLREQPADAYLRDHERQLITALLHNGYQIIIVSGRPASFLEQQFANLPVTLVAEHGAMIRNINTTKWKTLITNQVQRWYPIAETLMKHYTIRVPGSIVEKKKHSIAWHYRQSPESFASYMSLKLAEELASGLSNLPVEILNGNKIVEARSMQANKGAFLRKYLADYPQNKQNLVVAGDDRTDEDMFQALIESDDVITIKVGQGPSVARYLCQSPEHLNLILQNLIS